MPAHRATLSRMSYQMRASLVCLNLIAAVANAQTATQLPSGRSRIVSDACAAFDQQVDVLVASGRSQEAEQMLSQALLQGDPPDRRCIGLALSNMSAMLRASGRLADAERTAARAVHILEETLPPEGPALVRPLGILVSIRLELGRLNQARQVLKRLQSIPVSQPEDRALVSALAASVQVAEGRWAEADSQYIAAVEDLRRAGRGNTADAGAFLTCLGLLRLKAGRWNEAHLVLDEALSVLEHAPDAVAWDRAKLLNTRGVLWARQRDWGKAEQDLAHALAIADSEPRADSSEVRPLLVAYRDVLRKDHRRSDARAIQNRITALGGDSGTAGPVDVAELLPQPRSQRK